MYTEKELIILFNRIEQYCLKYFTTSLPDRIELISGCFIAIWIDKFDPCDNQKEYIDISLVTSDLDKEIILRKEKEKQLEEERIEKANILKEKNRLAAEQKEYQNYLKLKEKYEK